MARRLAKGLPRNQSAANFRFFAFSLASLFASFGAKNEKSRIRFVRKLFVCVCVRVGSCSCKALVANCPPHISIYMFLAPSEVGLTETAKPDKCLKGYCNCLLRLQKWRPPTQFGGGSVIRQLFHPYVSPQSKNTRPTSENLFQTPTLRREKPQKTDKGRRTKHKKKGKNGQRCPLRVRLPA